MATLRNSILFPNQWDLMGGVWISGNGAVVALHRNHSPTYTSAMDVYAASGGAWSLRASFTGSTHDPYAAALNHDGSVLVLGYPVANLDQGSNTVWTGRVDILDWTGTAYAVRTSFYGDPMRCGDYGYGLICDASGFGGKVALSPDASTLTAGGRRGGVDGFHTFDLVGGGWVPAPTLPHNSYETPIYLRDTRSLVVYWPFSARKISFYSRPGPGTQFALADEYAPTGADALAGQTQGVAQGVEVIAASLASGALRILQKTSGSWVARETIAVAAYTQRFALSADASVLLAGEYVDYHDANWDTVIRGVQVWDLPPVISTVLSTATSPLSIRVIDRAPVQTCPLAIRVIEGLSTTTGPLAIRVIERPGHTTEWVERATLAGSELALSGPIRISHEAGSARTASLSYLPAAGPIAVADLVGRALVIELAHNMLGIDRTDTLFSGRVDTPSVDLTTGLVTITASDGRTSALDALTRSEIDTITPVAHWSPLVNTDTAAGATYARERLETLPASLDLDPAGGWVLSPWTGRATARSLIEGDVVEESLQHQIAPRSDLVNQIVVNWTYRAPRLAVRRARWVWNMNYGERLPAGVVIPQFPSAYTLFSTPTRAMIQDAAAATSWTVVSEAITQADTDYALPTQAIVAEYQFEQRYSQTLTESYSLTLSAPASVAAAGLAASAETYSGQAEFDASAWEGDTALAPHPSVTADYGEASVSGALGDSGREAEREAVRTLLAAARVRILDSHRHSVTVSVPLDPLVRLGDRLAAVVPTLTTAAAVGRIDHELDPDTGRAVTTFTLRPSAIDSDAALVTDTPLEPPAVPAFPAADETGLDITAPTQFPWPGPGGSIPPVDDDLAGYVCDAAYADYSGRFAIDLPAVPDAARNPATLTAAASYVVAVPEDVLILIL